LTSDFHHWDFSKLVLHEGSGSSGLLHYQVGIGVVSLDQWTINIWIFHTNDITLSNL